MHALQRCHTLLPAGDGVIGLGRPLSCLFQRITLKPGNDRHAHPYSDPHLEHAGSISPCTMHPCRGHRMVHTCYNRLA